MGLDRPGDDAQVARHLEQARAARRDHRRDLLRTVLHLVCWVVAGLAVMGWALHTSDAGLGRILWLAGETLWLSGVLFTLLAAYRRGTRRGDW